MQVLKCVCAVENTALAQRRWPHPHGFQVPGTQQLHAHAVQAQMGGPWPPRGNALLNGPAGEVAWSKELEQGIPFRSLLPILQPEEKFQKRKNFFQSVLFESLFVWIVAPLSCPGYFIGVRCPNS